MKDRIAIIALDLSGSDFNTDMPFSDLSAKDKIDVIVNNIQKACEELKKKEPESMWVAAWHEYAIRNIDKKYISVEEKQYLQDKMCELTKTYSQLVVISGPVQVARPLNEVEKKAQTPVAKLEKTKQRFGESTYPIRKEEEKDVEKEVESHFKDLTAAIEERKTASSILSKLKALLPKPKIKIISNTTYVFQNGEILLKHRKVAPFKETRKPSHIFRPGSKHTKNPFIILKHPKSGEDIPIGIEICREHVFAHLKESLVSKDKPLLHFVLSNSVFMKLNNIFGNFAVHIDKVLKPRLIVAEESPAHQVRLYQHDVRTTSTSKMTAPIQPSTLEHVILKLLNDEVKQYEVLIEHLSELEKKAISDTKEIFNDLQIKFPIFKNLLNEIPASEQQNISKMIQYLNIRKIAIKQTHDSLRRDLSDPDSFNALIQAKSIEAHLKQLEPHFTNPFLPKELVIQVRELIHKDSSPAFNSLLNASLLDETGLVSEVKEKKVSALESHPIERKFQG